MSLVSEARQIAEYAIRLRDRFRESKAELVTQLRATEEWRQVQTDFGNKIIQTVAPLVQRRAEDGHFDAWIMDVDYDQYANIEHPQCEFPIEAIQAKMYGAARIVGEYLIKEGFKVLIKHKGNINGMNFFHMIARWS